MDSYFELIIGAIFINNILLAKFLGNCPFLGVSKKMDTAIGMSAAVVFVLTLAGIITWVVDRFILTPFGLGYIQTLAFILVIATLVQFVELFLRKAVPALYKSLGIFLPLITTNCAVLGAALINIQEGYNLLETIVFSAASAVGFGLALVLFAGLRERFEIARIPKPLQGTGIGLVTAGLLALSFFAFKGMI
jgi:Na+-translocating ferredoxin:NAD+ oxidoreductase subunit A